MTRKFFPRKDAMELSKIYNLLWKKYKTTVGFSVNVITAVH